MRHGSLTLVTAALLTTAAVVAVPAPVGLAQQLPPRDGGAMDPVPRVPAASQDPPSAGQESRAIRGSVSRAADGAVLRGARVAVHAAGRDPIVVFSDVSGTFEAPVPLIAGVVMKVSKAGYAPVVLPLTPAVRDGVRVLLDSGAALTGQIVDPSGTPVAYAMVTAERSNASVEQKAAGASAFSTRSNERGEFRLGGLPAGGYALSVARSRVIRPAAVEIRQDRETYVTASVEASADHPMLGLMAARMTLAASGAVEGVVRDDFAEPLEGVAVTLWRRVSIEGRTGVQRVESAVTDDRGQYRIAGINAGRYYVAATTADTWTENGAHGSYAPVYYPGRLVIEDALAIDVGSSLETRGIDLSFIRTRPHQVTGIVRDASGRPLSGSVVLLGTGRSGLMTLRTRSAAVGVGGAFVFNDVPPGDYVIQATRTGRLSSEILEFGLQRVTVDSAGTPPVTVTTAPVASVSGRIVLEGRSLSSQVPELSIYTERDGDFAGGEFSSPTLAVAPDLTFRVSGLAGPTRFVMRDAPPGWWLKSVDISGVNAAETPFTFDGTTTSIEGVNIVVSAGAATLTGRVLDAAGRRVDAYTVIVFAEDEAQRLADSGRIKTAAGAMFVDGSFLMHSLPPGRYNVIAIPAVRPEAFSTDWPDRETLARLPTAAPTVSLSEGQRRFVDLRLVDWQP